MNIKEIFNIFEELANESGKNAKQDILKKYEDNKDFREALIFLLNPYIVTGLSNKKINKKLKEDTVAKGFIPSFKGIIEYLRKNNSGRDADIKIAQSFINSQETKELQDFAKKFVTKSLKIGVSEKTVNKVYGKGTIPSFAVMLAESYAKKESKIKGRFYATLKLDGNRCVAIVEEEGVSFFTRKGQEIDDMVELENQFAKFPNGVYDGELLLINKNNLPSDELFRATQKVVRKDGEKKDLEFYIFDILSLSEFQNGKSIRTYEQRRNTLDTSISEFANQSNNIKVLPVLYEGEDKNMITALMKWVEEKGYEGIMINTADGKYVNKRTADLQKVKTMETADLLVLSIEVAESGQFEGLLARVNVEYKGSVVGVGSGFTLEQRREFVENPDLIAGRIIEVQYFKESKDEKTGLPSLRFPIFKSIRHDKGVDDINYE